MQVRAAVDSRSVLMRNLATMCLVTVPYTQVSMSKLAGDFAGVSLASAATLFLLTLVVLVTMRIFNITITEAFQFGKNEADPKGLRRAVVLASSQKTLPVAIAVLGQMGSVIGSAVGLASIPCVLAHLTQVIVDSFLVSWWKANDLKVKLKPT